MQSDEYENMKRISSIPDWWRAGLMLAATATAILTLSTACLSAADAKAEKPAKTEKPKKGEKKKFTGAELYAMHCNRCHPERYPTERTAAQWKTIMLHMRVRANLPAEQAKEIMKYLQEDSGK